MATELNAVIHLHNRVPDVGLRTAVPAASSSTLPTQAQSPTHETKLPQALMEMAQQYDSAHTGLQFRMDHEAGRMVVSVVDTRDGTVLRQLPSEVALRIARQLDEYQGHLVKEIA